MRATSHSRTYGRRSIAIAVALLLFVSVPAMGQTYTCATTTGVRDTHTRAWFPAESYDGDFRLRLRTGADFVFFFLDKPASKLEFSVVSRTSENEITIVAHRLKEPMPTGMTHSVWSQIKDDMLDGMLDQVHVDDLGRYSLNTYGAQNIMLEAVGPSVGYGIASSESWSNKPSWCQEPATPTPPPSPTPRATPTQGSPINWVEVPSDILPVIVHHAIIADAYEPATCFEIAANLKGDGRSTAPDFLLIVRMPDGDVHRWKFQRFENGSVYIAPGDRPCDIAVEYLR